jgi:hypothetical protein
MQQHGLNGKQAGKGLSYLVRSCLNTEHWQVPFPRHGSRQRQNILHYDNNIAAAALLYSTFEGDLSTTSIGSPCTVLVKIPSLIPFATRSIGAGSHVHDVRSYIVRLIIRLLSTRRRPVPSSACVSHHIQLGDKGPHRRFCFVLYKKEILP